MTHQEVIELLPWYANATLSEAERRAVSDHLSDCAPCRAELEELTLFQNAVVEAAGELQAPSTARFRQAMAEIESFERARHSAQKESGAGWSERIRETLLGWLGPMPSFGRALVAAQFLLILGLAGGLGYALRERDYSTLSGTTQTARGSRLAIRFNEAISESEMRQLLRGIDGKIVDGPSALGIYTIELAAKEKAAIDKVVESLRTKMSIVTYVERLG